MNRKTVLLLPLLLNFAFCGCAKTLQQPKKTADTLLNKDGYDLNEQELTSNGYRKTFEEDFSGDLSKWNIWNSGAYNNELQLYRPENLSVKEGVLIITAKKEQSSGPRLPENNNEKLFDYTSGRLESKFTLSASAGTPEVRVSARMIIPQGSGLWPAFWTYGEDWPTNGEIDIIEGIGDPHQYITNYFYGKNAGTAQTVNASSVDHVTTSKNLSGAYHVYEVIWTKDKLTFLLDGNIVATKTSDNEGGKYIPSFFGKLQHITLNLAIGGDIFEQLDPSTIQTGSLYVDWVKVFAK